MMGMFLLHESTHQQMDSIRSKFFWRGGENKFRYHMTKWENMCIPKDFGGLGIINTRTMNEAFMAKWVGKIYNSNAGDPCIDLLRAKYLSNVPFAKSKRR
jgi:hypothetical protein